MSEDDPLSDEPFKYIQTKNGLVLISFQGKVITTLGGKDAARFLAKVQSLDTKGVQLVMAKATGHFKHGNERPSKPSRN